jgi:hypothetical protein
LLRKLQITSGLACFQKGGSALCGRWLHPKDQPQRATIRETAGLADVLRLVFDTAAVRPDFENTP